MAEVFPLFSRGRFTIPLLRREGSFVSSMGHGVLGTKIFVLLLGMGSGEHSGVLFLFWEGLQNKISWCIFSFFFSSFFSGYGGGRSFLGCMIRWARGGMEEHILGRRSRSFGISGEAEEGGGSSSSSSELPSQRAKEHLPYTLGVKRRGG